jgi:hypothetical protein
MRGYLLWLITDRHKEARTAWQVALDKFDGLYKFPILPETDPDWYLERWKEMSELLKITIEQDGQNLISQTPPAENGSAPSKSKSTSTSSQTKTIRAQRARAYRVAGPIPAGSPRPIHWTDAYVEIERVLKDDHPHYIVSLTESRIVNLMGDKRKYFLQVNGDSMNNARPTPINDGDYVLIISQSDADDNDIVAAEIIGIDADATLKRLAKHSGNRMVLHPESTNPANQEYEFIQGDRTYAIRGVVKAVFKKVVEKAL